MKKVLRYLIVLLAILFFYSRSKMNSSNADAITVLMDEIEQNIPNKDKLNPEVSKAAISWHLAHSLKTLNNICDAVKESNPEDFESSFNFQKNFVLTSGIIPRGKATAPESVRPPDIILVEDLKSELIIVRKKVNDLLALDENAHFSHPIFGKIKKSQTIRFLEVHTNHHLKIVRDILKE